MSMNVKELAEMLQPVIDAGQLSMLYLIFLVYVAGIALGVAVLFLLKAIGVYRIASRMQIRGAALAFLPGFSGYAFGAVADGLKKRKPTNYSVHMLMLGLFSFAATVVYYVCLGGRFVWLYEMLESGTYSDLEKLLVSVFEVTTTDTVFYIAYYVQYVVGMILSVVTFFAFVRILLLFRSKKMPLMLFLYLMIPEVVAIYCFAVRNKRIYTKLPTFGRPDASATSPFRQEEKHEEDKPDDDNDDHNHSDHHDDNNDNDNGKDDGEMSL